MKAQPIETPWATDTSAVTEHYEVDPETGLSDSTVAARTDQFGPNTLREQEQRSAWQTLFDQFRSAIVLLLAAAGVAAFLLGKFVEGVSIFVVLVINGAIGFVTERRAIASVESLQELSEIDARVRRDGEVVTISAAELVPGDIVILNAGAVVPADLRVLEASKLQADESALTGESVPVGKSSAPVDGDTPLAERENMLYKGTHVTRGTAEAVVVATGMDTELGAISASLAKTAREKTPLQADLDELGHTLVPFLLVVAVIVLVSGWLRGQDLFLMVETAIALAIATVPEGLPVVATLLLARGMWRMADRDALVSNLASVETLGSTNVICTDKTGTLTENEMTVTEYLLPSGSVSVTGTGIDSTGVFEQAGDSIETPSGPLLEALEVGVLCNNASVEPGSEGDLAATGDPTEVALLVAGLKAGIDRSELLETVPEAREVSFDPARKMMATYHETDGDYRVAVKGAPEAVVEAADRVLGEDGTDSLSKADREAWLAESERMAEDGLRVLALATKTVGDSEAPPYEGLSLIGLVAMIDPPRTEVAETIQRCQEAGVRVVMATGDHAGTARNVGRSVGLGTAENTEPVLGSALDDPESLAEAERERLLDASIFARVSPENKLDLIELHQTAGSVVAMTGDGVNDAPALKNADIGVAMGQRGTQVAREASDMVLRDDNFESIYHAIREGRVIFRNIRKFVVYLMSCNLSELLAILLASIVGFPLPLLPLQILFLNVVTDIFPAFALGGCAGDSEIMCRPPRDQDEPILTRTHWTELGLYGALIAVATVGAFALGGQLYGGMGHPEVVTISFLTLAFAQLWHVFNMRDPASGVVRNEVTENGYVWGALALSSLLVVGTVYLPGVSLALGTAPIQAEGWLVVLGMSLVPLLVGQVVLLLRGRLNSPEPDSGNRS
ncbi:cation-translocating P-type ATPase [Halodesulfurarchaeum formicicum]|uniref:P-type ATPase n=1 Tax=Halodesulfurarchaeum formicicum TaxID=1873524 RepID=A0A1J1AD01_9EURY|nr:HAD-IC family P-type ATPase [Halodesulfurarchaeum formicicum]APE95765.1 P-type ATPase [Halodesulfurarchaeum formicicum]